MGGLCPAAVAQGYPANASRPGIPALAKVFPGITLTESLDYSFQSTLFMASARSGSGSANLLALTHEIRYRLNAGWRQKWWVNCELYHQLGFQYFFDSIHQISIDENLLRIESDYSLAAKLAIRTSAELRSRLLNEQVMLPNDSGQLVTSRRGSFLTPLRILIQASLAWKIPAFGSVAFSLSGLRITWLRDRDVFVNIREDQYYGVNRGKQFRAEYGLTLKTVLSHRFLRLVQWDLDMQLFKNFNDPWDLEMKNMFEIRPTRYLKLTLKTRLFYDSAVCEKLLIENHLAAGISLHL